MADTTRMTTAAAISVVPANEASWDDLQAVFGTRGDASRCQCQRFKIRDMECASVPVAERARRLRADRLRSARGAHDEWPRRAPRRRACRVVRGRAAHRLRALAAQSHRLGGPSGGQDRRRCLGGDLFPHPQGFRRQGISYALARAAVDFARERGARALEGHPMITQPGKEVTWGELRVGSRSIFAAAGFAEVSRPSLHRVVMRIDF